MANIHAGEVEGKEAAQHLIRDLATGALDGVLDRVIVLVAPIYNADGNDKIDINNRSEQNGPAGGVGTRENAQRLDLNRDFMKLESPEARGLITNVFNRWDPHVIIDLHTTNGSYHAYALTFSPALNPNTDSRIIAFTRGRLLPDISKNLLEKYRYRTYFYGNFSDGGGREQNPDQKAQPKAWITFDHRPRFGNNYVGLRNRIAILSEAYSYLDFRSRVDVTDKFVRTILLYVASHSADVVKLIRDADRAAATTMLTGGNEHGFGIAFDKKPSEHPVEILMSSVTRTTDPRNNRVRLAATGEAHAVKLTEIGEFRATRTIAPPAAYLLTPDQRKAVDLLLRHGIAVEELKQELTLDVDRYVVTGMTQSARAFQGHRETKLTVNPSRTQVTFPSGSFLISMHQPKAALIFYLLEPESDDGLADWNFFDESLAAQAESSRVYPVYRAVQEPRCTRVMLRLPE
ncbi:MAG TPA: M14 family metallopeptidase, partial [Blastocatellia bacterium]|nr:M14 family metallopeptidase [Blastocatellia bacterium]